jgi:hypothetical protein
MCQTVSMYWVSDRRWSSIDLFYYWFIVIVIVILILRSILFAALLEWIAVLINMKNYHCKSDYQSAQIYLGLLNILLQVNLTLTNTTAYILKLTLLPLFSWNHIGRRYSSQHTAIPASPSANNILSYLPSKSQPFYSLLWNIRTPQS